MKKMLLLSTLGFMISPLINAQEAPSSRLERIETTGLMVAGYRETSVPFSYLDPYAPAGMGVDLTFKVLDAVREKLNRPDIQLRWNPVTLSTRLPMMTSNTIDINCATDTHTKEREALVDFSVSYYLSELSGAVRSDRLINSLQDLAGLKISVARNTTTTELLQETLGKDLPFTVTYYPTNRQALKAVHDEEADVYINSDAIIGGELLRMNSNSNLKIVGFGGEPEPFACMLPKGDQEFKALVDETFVKMMQSGEMTAIYNRWLVNPVHNYGASLHIPMSHQLELLYQSPSDQAFVK
ncbi:amino acid ABC transporter substrate-binding protein [Marinomonas fungiae]|uniref:amino acid ABC transporter substrate-binding protein n=1 Tax=Marinomonas fungiae TaxID=1137284 RepID=UPI003A900495